MHRFIKILASIEKTKDCPVFSGLQETRYKTFLTIHILDFCKSKKITNVLNLWNSKKFLIQIGIPLKFM